MTRPASTRSLRRSILVVALLFVLVCIAIAAAALVFEARTSWLQARLLPGYAASLRYSLDAGPSPTVIFPSEGPFDIRLGYALLPQFKERLTARGYEVTRQTRFSPELMDYAGRGYFPPYREKTRAGLLVRDCTGGPLYRMNHPARQYESFEGIPRPVVDALLYIENRDLLDPERPQHNPAVEWARLGKAVLAQVAKAVDDDYNAPGGSTLATQIEKYRHSPDGVTFSPADKLHQMVSASVRAYLDGPDTLAARERILLDYLNTVPLSAAPGYGEVNGLGDGMWVWFGANFEQVNKLLSAAPRNAAELAAKGLALRQVVSLMIAHRRPSFYLARGRGELDQLAESYLRLLGEAGLIEPALRDAALAQKLRYRDPSADSAVARVEAGKGAGTLRARLAGTLEVSQYDLDRLDLDVSSTLHAKLQSEVDRFLGKLDEEEFAREHDLLGERLLVPGKLDKLRYSFTLMERTGEGNRVRVQTDTASTPFDINEGSKLELGSTAKLRVLASYLEIVAELHERYTRMSEEEYRAAPGARLDPISRWALGYLGPKREHTLLEMLDASLERRFSASPKESFFTGGGVHTFGNFRREDDGRNPTLREALQASINLPFVRLMREIVRYEMYQIPGSTARLLDDSEDPRREEYLSRFADREGQEFLRRFWRKHRGRSPEEMQASIFDGLRRVPDRLAAAYRYLNPKAELAAFDAFMQERMGENKLDPARIEALYKRFDPEAWDLADQGYLARVHPLELWLVGYQSAHPTAMFAELVEASREERQEVYKWLFRTRAKNAQDQRILSMLEVEAFLEIHRRWARLGYPFEHLVPSLATALGSSGDRPAALAELMGIIVNDGQRAPTQRIVGLRFAADTPYETSFGRVDDPAEQVMLPEVAQTLREAITQVVEAGTARRLAGVFKLEDGSELAAGGKTGTGDNRIVTVSAGGQQKSSVSLNRTATFVFYLGPRHFGTLTAYVTGSDAESFRFTSALPVQILKAMAPVLRPYLGNAPTRTCAAAEQAAG